MLIEFSVKNFMSFKDKVTLSMEKGNGLENSDNFINTDYGEILKTASIYGANASGKSNLIKAFTCAIIMVRNSNLITVEGKWDFIKPFMFDDELNNICEFEFIFIYNEVKYKYSFSTDSTKIYNESLDAYYTQKPTNIFKRINTNNYEFNSDKKILEPISLKTNDNKLFLNTATNWNYDKTKDAYLWFINSIDTFDTFDRITDSDIILYSKDNNLKEFSLKLLNEADVHIKDFNIYFNESNKDDFDILIPNINRTNGTFKITEVKILLEHEIVDSKNNLKTYKLNFSDESSGTKVLFAIAPFLKRAFESNKIIIVDELEKSMHPKLIEFIISLFNNTNINKVGSQLIFTTHVTNLLNIQIFRRDQIWFTEKDPNSGLSKLFPLDSFSVRKDENIEKGYLNGRYGAIPFIKDIDLWLEDMNK